MTIEQNNLLLRDHQLLLLVPAQCSRIASSTAFLMHYKILLCFETYRSVAHA